MNSLSIPELIVFDLAGTTIKDNNDVPRVLKNTLKEYEIEVSIKEANTVMGIPKPVAIEKLLKSQFHPDITPELIDTIHRRFVKNMIRFYAEDPGVKENDGVSETFRKLKEEGIKIAVDTGFNRAITEPLLERMTWKKEGLIDLSVTSDEVSAGRPAPDMIYKAMTFCNVAEAIAVAKVGDTSFDIQEGKSAGCGWTIGITTGAFSEADLSLEKPTHLIQSIPQILPIFGL